MTSVLILSASLPLAVLSAEERSPGETSGEEGAGEARVDVSLGDDSVSREMPTRKEKPPVDLRGEETKKGPSRYDKLSVKDGTVYRDCRVVKIEHDGLLVAHAGGMAKLSFFDLPESVQVEWGFDPFRAMAFYRENVEKERALRWRLFWERQHFESEQAKLEDSDRLWQKARREWVPVEAEVIQVVGEGRFLARCKRVTFQATKTKSTLGFIVDGPPKRVLVPLPGSPMILKLSVEGARTPSRGTTWRGFVHPSSEGKGSYRVKGAAGSASIHAASPAERVVR